MANPQPVGRHAAADLAMVVYLEPLLAGRRVLVVGSLGFGAIEHLREGAGSLDVREGSAELAGHGYDVVIADLSRFWQGWREVIGMLRAAVAEHGWLVIAANADGVPNAYEDLFAATKAHFPHVQMFGQAPVAGYALAEFRPAETAPDLTFDQTLLSDEPETAIRYLAIAGPAHGLDAYGVVQLPRSRYESPEAAEHERLLASRTAALADLDGEVERVRLDLQALRAESETRGAALRAARVELERLRAQPRAEANDPRIGEEHAELEASLRERARLVRELEAELARRGTLVRDLAEEVRELRGAREVDSSSDEAPTATAAPKPSSASHAEPAPASSMSDSDAVARALAAEAARTEATFALDELRGHVVMVEKAREAERNEASAMEALLVGTVRGLRARTAELDEARSAAEARLSLALDDLSQARSLARAFERQLEEAREQLQLALMRAAGSPPPVASADAAELARLRDAERALAEATGTLRGQLHVAREALLLATEERDLARSETIRLTALVTGLEERAAESSRASEARIDELSRAVRASQAPTAPESVSSSSLRGELDGLRARLDDRELAVAAFAAQIRDLTAESAVLRAEAEQLVSMRDDLDALRNELASLRVAHSTLTVQAVDAQERAAVESRRAADLTMAMAAREALLQRLEADVVERDQRVRALEVRVATLSDDARHLRESHDASTLAASGREEAARQRAAEQVRAIDELKSRAQELFEERNRMRSALEDTRSALTEIATSVTTTSADGLTRAQRIAAVERGENEASIPPLAEDVRAHVEELQKQAGERELMLRTLAAQVEERDERIRALERDRERPRALPAHFDELERERHELRARVAKLAEELDLERRARAAAEVGRDNVRATRSRELESEVRRLNEQLGDREAEVVVLQARVAKIDRELAGMKDAGRDVRAGLESLLASATAAGDPATAERISRLIRELGVG